jgi:hypothetical protein
MKKDKIENLFSKERINKYFLRFPMDENKAFELYKANIKLSESFYTILSIFEVSLRNAINRTLQNHFRTDNWFENIKQYPELMDLTYEIDSAISKIKSRGELENPGKITAELTFGFWSKLFNSKYESILWKPLRLVFPNIPKSERQRRKLSAPINRIRNLRNRVFHYEPIIWNMEYIENQIAECYKLLKWINEELVFFTKELDYTKSVIDYIKLLYNNDESIID